MANMVARPQSLQDYLHDQLGWFDLDARAAGRWPTGSSTTSTPTATCKARLEDLLDPDAPPRATGAGAAGAGHRAEARSAGRRRPRPARVPAAAAHAGHAATTNSCKTLISNHLEDLEHNRLPVIERKTGYSIELIQEALGELRKLNPKPGADFGETFVPNVTPDVFVELDDDGKYQVRLEDGRTPKLYISPYYRKMLMSDKANAETREYIKRKINSAQWLIESIEQRRNTLTRVAQAIVDHQTEFLDKGPECDRAAEDAADRRQGGRARDHGQPGGRRQMDSDAAGHLSAQAVLLRRHRQRRRRRSRLGHRAAEAARDRRQRRQAAPASATTSWSRNWPSTA